MELLEELRLYSVLSYSSTFRVLKTNVWYQMRENWNFCRDLKVRSIIYSKDLVLYCIGLGPFSLINTLRKSNSNRVNVTL